MPRPWRPFPTLKFDYAVAAQSYNIHNDRDGNGVDRAYYTRLAVSESPILHNSGDETLAHVCANRPRPVIYTHIIYLYNDIVVHEINYVITVLPCLPVRLTNARRYINEITNIGRMMI